MRFITRPSWRNENESETDDTEVAGPSQDLHFRIKHLPIEQKTALKQFRERVDRMLPSQLNSDLDLLRWLAARNYNVDKAEDMLLKSLEWRKEWKVDTILEWNPPEVLNSYYGFGFSGYDKIGAPVYIIPYGNSDVRGLLHCCSKKDFIKYTLQILERSLKEMKKKSEELGHPIVDEIFIFDLENFSFKEFTWKPALDVILQLVQIYEANYPEILKYAFIINAPAIFSAAFAFIKPFLHEVTYKKIKIFGRTGWQEAVLEEIPSDQLPVHWGGTMIDLDGNPKCPSKICLGGKVPVSCYLKNRQSDSLEDNIQCLVLPKCGKQVFEYDVGQEGTEIRWEFQSDDYDVGFGISRVIASGEEEPLLPLQRVNCHMVPETGSLTCTVAGIYKITFDNEFSYLRSKKLYYNIRLHSPKNHFNT